MEESRTGAEMELLKLYDCCVPNFRLRPSVARRGEVVVVCQGLKKLMKSGPAWKIWPISSIYSFDCFDCNRLLFWDFEVIPWTIYICTRYLHRKTYRGDSKMGKVELTLLKPNDSEERSAPPIKRTRYFYDYSDKVHQVNSTQCLPLHSWFMFYVNIKI